MNEQNDEFQIFKENLQNNVKEYLELDEHIKALNKAIKERRKKKNDLSLCILESMKHHDINFMNIKGGKLIYSVTKTKAPMNKETIGKSLSNYFNSNQRASEVCKYLFDNREKIEKVKLKRTTNKKGIDLTGN
jgi:hypothetical protein